MTRQIRIILITLIFALANALQAESQTSLKISLDSAYLLMGNTTPLHIELITPAGSNGKLLLPADTLSREVEILDMPAADTSDVNNGRTRILQDLILQSFDSGTYVLNPILYVDGNDTLASNKLVLKVLPANVDSLSTIHDYADVADVDRKLIDYLPDFIADYGLWILAILLLLALGYFTIRRLTSRQKAEQEKIIVIPPYELAIQELEALRSDKLCEQGREKEYYTRLTDILRQYLHGRFGINAMEMTSTQIRHILQSNEETRLSKQNMDRVLETADFVKFAKIRPLPDDNTQAFNSALRFVEDTKPKPIELQEDNKDDNNTSEN